MLLHRVKVMLGRKGERIIKPLAMGVYISRNRDIGNDRQSLMRDTSLDQGEETGRISTQHEESGKP